MTRRLVTILAILTSACGDDGNTCGPNTTEQDGACVASVACGAGTVDDGAGSCVPDGSVVCSDGTVFDMATGTCVPSDDVCGDGTVLVDGVCRDPATVTPNATEEAETNDATGAGEIVVPAIGAAGFVVHGCITPRDSGATADIDPWLLTVTEPTVLEIAADGLGGLAAGFAVFNADDNEALADYARFGVNTLSDGAKRQVYLPAAGDYLIALLDQRTLLGFGAAGNDASCYYATITQVALPAPTALTLPTTAGMDSGNVQVFRFTSSADGTIFHAVMTEDADVLDSAWVATRAGAFHGLATDQGGNAAGPARYVGAVDNGDSVDVIVDMEFNSGIAPQPFQIDAYTIGATALPMDGTTVTVTKQNGVNPRDPIVDDPNQAIVRNLNYYYFDVAADTDVVHFDLTATEQAVMAVFRTDVVDNDAGSFDGLVLLGPTGAPLDFSDQFVRFLSPGRYYVGVFQLGGTAGDTYSLSSALTPQTAAAVAVGDTLTAQAISDVTGSAWRELDPAAAKWIQMTGGGTNLGGNLEVLYYPASFEGWLDNLSTLPIGDIGTDSNFDQLFAADGSTGALGRVALNYPLRPFLVRLRSDAGPGAGQTFDYAVANRTFTDLMTATEAAPANAANVTVAANSSVRFLVQATGRVSITTANTTFDAAIHWVRYDELPIFTIDTLGVAGNESMNDVPSFLGYVAFEIENLTGTNGTLDISVTTLEAAPFMEICPSAGGSGTLILDADDQLSSTLTLPFTFSLFGSAVTQYKVSTNGWLTFNTATAGSAPFPPVGIPDAATPNGVLAGFWDDLEGEVCRRDLANRTIIEWRGFSWNTFDEVHAQVSIYNTGNRIEWAYGAGQTADGAGALAGVESTDGTQGFELFNDTSLVRPGYRDAVLLP